MKKEELIQEEIDLIQNSDTKQEVIKVLQKIPEYFWTVPASSSGKYHPEFSLGEGGLVRHTKAAVYFANQLFDLNDFSEEVKDLIIISILFHDTFKQGNGIDKKTVHEHPILAAEFCKKEFSCLGDDKANFIAGNIASHMGKWNTSKYSQIILPIPVTKSQKFVHMCDYLSSRKELTMKNFTPAYIAPENIVINFGKFNGKTIGEIKTIDSNYLDWLVKNTYDSRLAENIKKVIGG